MHPSKRNTLTINGTQIYYERAGAGHPLVMLHGHLLDSEQWDAEFAYFASHYQVVRYDARGFGQSSQPPEPFAYHKDLRALMQALEIDHAHLLGCSGGGATIIDFALTYPQMVDKLILVGTGLSGYRPSGPVPPQLLAMNEARQGPDLDRAVELSLQALTDGPRRTPDQVNPVARARTRIMTTRLFARPVVPEAQPQSLEPPAWIRLHKITHPTLAIIGAEDQPPLHEITDLVVSQIPGAQKIVMTDAGHHPNLEHPALFQQLVQHFLQHA